MAKQRDQELATLLEVLCDHPTSRLLAGEDGGIRISSLASVRKARIPEAAIRRLCAGGLVTEVEPGAFAATLEARSWLKRRRGGEQPFRMQHGDVVANVSGAGNPAALVELDESPVAALARRTGKNGEPWLAAHALAAAERFRRDFEIGRLQPRVTANWSASVSDGRRDGDRGGVSDLTDMALAARLRFDQAAKAAGPELSGVLIDICCFLKGLETVERERRWPARAAKLVLRLALESLARHYGLTETATGKASRELRHWGAEDYRPDIT